MNPRPRAFRPGVPRLEPRDLMSAADVSGAALTRPLIAGTLHGRYQAGQDNRAADAPLHVRLSGSGTMQGKARLAGSLHLGGFRMANAPDVVGTVTLSNTRGSLKILLAGSGGHSQVPRNQFTLNAGIVSGTGAYVDAQGVGSATLSFGADSLPGRAAAGPATFTLDLKAPVR